MKRLVVVLGIALVAGAVAVWLVSLVPRNMFLMSIVDHFAPGLISTRSLAHNLDSNDPDLVRESLAHLRGRRDQIAVARAIGLLQSTNDYIWLNAADYVADCGRQEAVPYLIKALRHTAWRGDNITVHYLRWLTGQDFGTDVVRWQTWWVGQHPDTDMDWTSHLGASPRLRHAAATQSIGQPDGAANGSQPIRSETNSMTSAAGSRR